MLQNFYSYLLLLSVYQFRLSWFLFNTNDVIDVSILGEALSFQSVLRTEILAEAPSRAFHITFPQIFRKISSKKFVRQRIAHSSKATSFNSISLAISTGCCARVASIIHLRYPAHPRASVFFHHFTPRSTTNQPTQNAISLASRLLFPFFHLGRNVCTKTRPGWLRAHSRIRRQIQIQR